MKKIMAFLAVICTLSLGTCVKAEITGEVLSTDIGTLIDFEPVKSYNINDYTYIKAEDLRDYGFNVGWNEEARLLSITRNHEADRKICMSKEDINVKKNDIEQRKHVYDVYSTDIRTYLDGEEIAAYNVGGETLIQVDYLQKFGNFTYSDEERMVYIDILRTELDRAYENANAPKDVEIASDEYSTTVYNGEVKYSDNGNVPEGIGRMTYSKNVPDGLKELTTTVTTGFFNGTTLNGNAYIENLHIERGGSRPGQSETITYSSYKNGEKDGLEIIKEIKTDWSPLKMYEYTYVNGIQTGMYRKSEINSEYLYGFMVVEEGEKDKEGDTVNYVLYENNSPFVKIYHENCYNAFYVEKADSTLYSNSLSKVFTLMDTAPEPINTTPDIDNVKMIANSMTSLGESGDNGGRLLLLTDNGDVYHERRNYTAENAYWTDGLDLSEPVKVFSDAKYVYCENGYFVIKNDNSLWYWNDDYYNRQKTGNELYPEAAEIIKEPTKICEDVKSVSEGSGFMMVIKNDNTLWAKGNNECGQLGNGTNVNSDEFVKIMDGVSDVLCIGSYTVALKEDGTLWVWGKNDDAKLGIGNKVSQNIPVQITNVYKLK